MLKAFCNTCGREIHPGGFATSDLVRVQFHGYNEKTNTFADLIKEMDLCRGCYEKVRQNTDTAKQDSKNRKRKNMSKEELEEIAEQICDEYCRYPLQWDEEEEGIPLSDSEICRNCPLNRF